jgi:hypothetical protein
MTAYTKDHVAGKRGILPLYVALDPEGLPCPFKVVSTPQGPTVDGRGWQKTFILY